MKRSIVFLLVSVALVAAGQARAGEADLFVAKCGACHKRGGQAPAINPADKAGRVWGKYFRRGRHPVDLSSSISEDELATIVQYLKDHAADSDQPAAAVIPK